MTDLQVGDYARGCSGNVYRVLAFLPHNQVKVKILEADYLRHVYLGETDITEASLEALTKIDDRQVMNWKLGGGSL